MALSHGTCSAHVAVLTVWFAQVFLCVDLDTGPTQDSGPMGDGVTAVLLESSPHLSSLAVIAQRREGMWIWPRERISGESHLFVHEAPVCTCRCECADV